ncbi:MAG: class I SAM-dependent methyltransferase [Thermodesulfovibrionales bacterium]
MDSVDDAELFNNPFLKKLHEHLIIKREIRHVRKIFSMKEFSLLDIGCGTGWTSSVWEKEGAEVVGLEPSGARGKIAKERYGLRIIQAYLEDLEDSEKFDVIVIRHVLEHFAEPFEILKKVKTLLRENGLILLVVPNINCIGRYIFNDKWSWILPWHCNFFSPRSLSGLLDRAGFVVLKLYQTPSPLWYPESFLRLFPKTGQLNSRIYSKLSSLIFLPFMPVVIAGYVMGLSDNITLIAKMK